MLTKRRRTNHAKRVPLPFKSMKKSGTSAKTQPRATEFVEIVRAAVNQLPATRRRKRVMHDGSCATGLEGLLRESIRKGAALDDIRRVQTALHRGINVVITERWPISERAIAYAIGAETASNSKQNEDTHAVLTNGTLGDVERLYESTRVQRDMDEILMESLAVRATQLRQEATR